MTINCDALDLTVQGTSWAPFQTWEPPPTLLATSGGPHWIPVQTCSLQDRPQSADIWRLLKACMVSTSYWNPTRMLSCCCPLMKLGKGNVFMGMCLFMWGWVSVVSGPFQG